MNTSETPQETSFTLSFCLRAGRLATSHPVQNILEAGSSTVTVKQADGYSGDPCMRMLIMAAWHSRFLHHFVHQYMVGIARET
jgi:hypothetical protein